MGQHWVCAGLGIVAFCFVYLLTLPLASISSAFNSITSPSYTSLVSLIRSPMDLRKFSISTSVFFTSLEYTSLATRGVKGTCSILRRIPHRRACKLVLGFAFMTFFPYCVVGVRFAAFCFTLVPSSCAIPRAKAVFPVPGAPASSSALPAIFFCRMRSTTSPHASLAVCCPTNPLPKDVAVPSSCAFRPVPRSPFPSFSTHARTHAVRHRTMHARVSSSFRSTPGLTVWCGVSLRLGHVPFSSRTKRRVACHVVVHRSTNSIVFTDGFRSTCRVHVVAMDVSRVPFCLVQTCFGAIWSELFRGA